MRKVTGAAIIFLSIALITQWVVVKYLPAWVYKIAIHRIDHKFNVWTNAGKTDGEGS